LLPLAVTAGREHRNEHGRHDRRQEPGRDEGRHRHGDPASRPAGSRTQHRPAEPGIDGVRAMGEHRVEPPLEVVRALVVAHRPASRLARTVRSLASPRLTFDRTDAGRQPSISAISSSASPSQ
jgi:hypothetical protein